MAQEEVEALGAEALQARIHLTHERASREAAVVGSRADGVEGLRAQQHLVAHRRAALRQPAADGGLAPAAAIRVGRVEHVDADLEGGVHDRERLLVGLALPVELGRGSDAAEVAAAERDPRDLEPGGAEGAVIHGAHDCVLSDRAAAAACRAASSTGRPQKPSGVEKISMSA